MHVYCNTFKQIIVLRSRYKAMENKIKSLTLIGIVLVLLIEAAVLCGIGERKKPVLVVCVYCVH
jgi:hypothetical protein